MANPTTNFGWVMPTSTDLVTDLPADFAVFGQAVDTSLADLKGGTTGQVLTKASNTDMDFTWAADQSGIPATILDAKGDLIAATAADTASRLAVGTNGQVLTADSTAATGLAWTTISTGPTYVGCSVYATAAQNISTATWTAQTYGGELWDTNGFHSTATNTSRITIPSGKAGKYLFTGSVAWGSNTSTDRFGVRLYANGANDWNIDYRKGSSSNGELWQSWSVIRDCAVNDYFEVYVWQSSGSTIATDSGNNRNYFQCVYLGA